ncbi:uncharacterized protein LOC130648829 [Hydractinia symbiolongicarpus]|uniref:uncharacterized protein LOC130648829 n=1 Tax=Hydractinia symbiolongicarpus TaxID=13093 RepID=UPI00254A8DB0|nr:uncharacterized protein LOC130648829 [Hydractinia symbiolongicarpus]
MLEFLSQFKFLKHVLPVRLPHPYSECMKQKSTIISMPIINANESKYSDCDEILRTFENWIAEIYNQAGQLEKLPDPQQLPNTVDVDYQADPGQTIGHVVFTEDDPMKEIKIPFSGDQLTRVWFAGAKHLLGGAHTPSDCLEHCAPFKPVMWHCKASLLQYSYSLLYAPESVKEIETLEYFREKYNRKDAKPSKVLDSYEGSKQLFLSTGRAYIQHRNYCKTK